jgi:hypothetical protein
MPDSESFWPDGARLAVTVSMQFEAGGQSISGASGPITEPVQYVPAPALTPLRDDTAAVPTAEDAVAQEVSMDCGVVLLCHNTRSGRE